MGIIALPHNCRLLEAFLRVSRTCRWKPYAGLEKESYGVNCTISCILSYAFTNTGDAIDSKGTLSGDTWNWIAESKMGDAKINVRVTIKEVSKTESTFKLEMSQNGGEFSVVEESTSHKVTAAAPAKKS
jgi:hypothetical protein